MAVKPGHSIAKKKVSKLLDFEMKLLRNKKNLEDEQMRETQK